LQNQVTDMIITSVFNPLNAATALTAPYIGGSVTTYTYNAPTLDFEREFYRIPGASTDMPILAWAHQWVETVVPFTGTTLDLFLSRAGILMRAIAYVVDGSTNDGIATAKVTDAEWIYGANETPMIFDPGFSRARQLRDYGRLFTKGAYVFEWANWISTPQTRGAAAFKNTYNTEAIINQRVHFDFASSLATGSYVRLIVERLIPIVANRTASPVATSGAPVGAQQSALQTGS
jgi:hypothetical protein